MTKKWIALATVAFLVSFLPGCSTTSQNNAQSMNSTLYDVNTTLNNIRALERNLGGF